MASKQDYYNKLRKCQSIEEVDEIGAKQLRNIKIKSLGSRILISAAAIAPYVYVVTQPDDVDTNSFILMNADKPAHMVKGMWASYVFGKIFDRLHKWWKKPKDADDEIENLNQSLEEKIIGEGIGTLISAGGWEAAQVTIPAFPGSHFSYEDIAADMAGHGVNVVIQYVVNSERLDLLDAVIKRKLELGEDPEKLPYRIGVNEYIAFRGAKDYGVNSTELTRTTKKAMGLEERV